uniref:Uncharacterized protein n=1 Tax=Pipistrellus kuhlii TaxID=59472 RepID=A0A7J8A7H9_PIPKU|nr:hypothetical protein mPipKuh1_008840 [Pipistrellus kuhlii]
MKHLIQSWPLGQQDSTPFSCHLEHNKSRKVFLSKISTKPRLLLCASTSLTEDLFVYGDLLKVPREKEPPGKQWCPALRQPIVVIKQCASAETASQTPAPPQAGARMLFGVYCWNGDGHIHVHNCSSLYTCIFPKT